MKRFVAVVALMAAPAIAATPEQVVQAQVEAFNAGDLDRFMARYTPTAVLYDHPGSVWLSGAAAMRTEYAKQFASKPKIGVTIPKRIVSGDYVIDEEVLMIDGQARGQSVAIYHVSGDRIDRVDFLPAQRLTPAKP